MGGQTLRGRWDYSTVRSMRRPWVIGSLDQETGISLVI